MTTQVDLRAAVEAAAELVREVEPESGKVSAAQFGELKRALLDVEAAVAAAPAEADELAGVRTAIYLRAAALAHAFGDAMAAQSWATAARDHAGDDGQRGLATCGLERPERLRRLIHARYLFTHDREGAARAICKRLVRDDREDAIATAARLELAAIRPLRGGAPSLSTINGFGLRFAGRRDQGRDGSYTTTHCLTALFIPVLPLRAYRVQDAYDGGYHILGRAPLSAFARWARLAIVAAVVLGITGVSVYSYLTNPARLARQRFDAALAAADGPDREAALARLDRQLTGPDVDRVDPGRRERAGAAVVRLTAAMVPTPFTPAQLDQAQRVLRRYQALPGPARSGAAMAEMQRTLAGWIEAVRDFPDAELVLTREAESLARAAGDQPRIAAHAARVAELRLTLAERLAPTEPTAALSMLMTPPVSADALAAAGRIAAALADQPSLLDEEPAALAAWLEQVPADDATRARVVAARDQAAEARPTTEAEGLTRPQLTAMTRKRPWDQRVALALAHADVDAGALEQAAARLRAIGADGHLVRDGRMLLASIEAQRGHLVEADALLSALLAPRLPRYVAAAAALEQAATRLDASLSSRLRTGAIPDSLRRQLEGPAITEDEQRAAVSAWVTGETMRDAGYQAALSAHGELIDVVSTALALGSVKLLRSQSADGAQREVLLADAERAFLAIRGAAEGQPSFHLGLGEIYARLGKVAESEAEFGALLAKDDLTLNLSVASVYRTLGNLARATEVATDVYDRASGDVRYAAAGLLSQLTPDDEDASERWLRASDPSSPFIQSSLLEVTGRRHQRAGRWRECADTYTDVARRHLAGARPGDAGYNNASIAYHHAYGCTGDVSLLDKAEEAMGRAYAASSDDGIVAGNYAQLLGELALLRVLGRHIDVAALRLTGEFARHILMDVSQGELRAELRAALFASPQWRRARDVAAQHLMLAPQWSAAYDWAFTEAMLRDDPAAVEAAVERMRRASVDTSMTRSARERTTRGEFDARVLETVKATIPLMDEVLAARDTDAKTRAVALYVRGAMRSKWAEVEGAADQARRCVTDLQDSKRAWPALDVGASIIACAVDAIALADADADAWRRERRTRGALSTLASLAERGDPRLARFRATEAWREIEALVAGLQVPPSIDDVNIARWLDSPAIAARAAAARRDPLTRLALEFAQLADPTDPALAESLARVSAN